MKLSKSTIGWMFYDFANSAFTTIIVSVVYSVYFINVVVDSATKGYGEMLWGRAVAISMTLVAITSPVFGAIADHSRAKKRFLFFNCYITIIFTALLFFVRAGDIMLGMIFFIVANYGFNGANVFYDAFLPEITSDEDMGKVSGYGWAFGYIGGLMALSISLPIINSFTKTGNLNVRLVFPAIALHLLIFSLVTFFWLKEVRRPSRRTNYFRVALHRISYSVQNIARLPELFRYLFAYLIYNTGILTVIIFASIYGNERFGIHQNQMIVYFIVAQLTSFIGAAVFGWLTDATTVKLSLNISIMIWVMVIAAAFFATNAWHYYIAVLVAGLAIGSSQANSRTMLSQLTPKSKQAEFFGFYTLTGRLSSIIGPLVYGYIAHKTGSVRWSILSLLLFFILGWIILQFVDLRKGLDDARIQEIQHNPK